MGRLGFIEKFVFDHNTWRIIGYDVYTVSTIKIIKDDYTSKIPVGGSGISFLPGECGFIYI
jgi:hypothetical protein